MEFLLNEVKGVFKMMNHKSKLQKEESKGRRGLIHMEELEELIEEPCVLQFMGSHRVRHS